MGEWIRVYGESIYGTRGGYLPLQKWGLLPRNLEKYTFIYLKIMRVKAITLEKFPFKRLIPHIC